MFWGFQSHTIYLQLPQQMDNKLLTDNDLCNFKLYVLFKVFTILYEKYTENLMQCLKDNGFQGIPKIYVI